MKSDIVDLQLKEHARTGKAVLVSEDGDKDKAVWLPLSQIEISNTDRSGVRDVSLPEWLAFEKGLI